MIVLTGNNLNERHKELNIKVNEAAKSKVSLKNIKDEHEVSDVDRLFKIDLASKYQNIDYILETLKSGDSLYISRALKCKWITNDEYAHLINPKFLEKELFPAMAPRMKKKLLSTISRHLRNGDRAKEFYQYCMQNKMHKMGMGFLLFTNEDFKIEILTEHRHIYNKFGREKEYLEHFIGNSYLLAELYLKVVPELNKCSILYKLRYLYSVSQEKYLDLLETCTYTEKYNFCTTSLNLSHDIMKKHKKRVIAKPWIYLHILCNSAVVKYSTSDDAKVYALTYLPDKFCDFWNSYYYQCKFFLKLIPVGERFSFLKKIFTDKYPGEAFEDNFEFYTHGLYVTMTDKEQENWALSHVASEKELHGCGNDYIWYQFVNFKQAFNELKKYILVAPDNNKRSDILKTLVLSTKNQEELTFLMDYYYDRHINELKEFKRSFLKKITKKHNVMNFNESSWASLDKILFSLDVYNHLSEDSDDCLNNDFRILSLLYHVINQKPVPNVITKLMLAGTIRIRWIRIQYAIEPKQLDLVFQYLFKCFVEHIISLIKTNDDSQNLKEIRRLIVDGLLEILKYYDKEVDIIPETILSFIMSKYYEVYKEHSMFVSKPLPLFGEDNIMRFIKQDSCKVIQKFSTIKKYVEQNRRAKLNRSIKKLKIYFNNDIAPEFLKLLSECLHADELSLHVARVAMYGIFNLADENYKLCFVRKYIPVDAKIDHKNISRNLLTIQTAICNIACFSRPPLPISLLSLYIKGDYVKFCIPIFNHYLANLTPPECLSFVESLLNNPLSIQKQCLRIAFKCFTSEHLQKLAIETWKNTKNVSLRKILYKLVFDKVNFYHDNIPAQWELFCVLNIMTNNLHEDDNKEVFSKLTSKLPPNVLGQFLQSAYVAVNTFPKKTVNYQRLAAIVRALESNLELISNDILLLLMEDHIELVLNNDEILKTDLVFGHAELNNAKWSLINKIIVVHINLHPVHLIMNQVLTKWHLTSNNQYVYQKLFTEFLDDLEYRSFKRPIQNYLGINSIFRTILHLMETSLPHKEIYATVWKLKLNIITRDFLAKHMSNIEMDNSQATLEVLENIIVTYSREIKNLFDEYLAKNMLFVSFLHTIIRLLYKSISRVQNNIISFLNSDEIKSDQIDVEISSQDIEVMLCSVLVECNNRDTYIFVLNILPRNYNGKYITKYLDVISKLKSVNDNEIQYYVCHKFYGLFIETSDYRNKGRRRRVKRTSDCD